MRVVWNVRAVADVGRIIRYVAEANPVAARRIGRELVVAGDSLGVFPFRGRGGRHPLTRELVAAFPYVLVYRIGRGEVTILRVWHAAQDRGS